MSRVPTSWNQRLWSFLKGLSKKIIAIIFSTLSVLLAACITIEPALFLNGKGTQADSWVMTYERAGFGLVFWLFAFPLLSCSLLYFIKQKFSRNNLPYCVGGLVGLPCYCFLGVVAALGGWESTPFCISFIQRWAENLAAQ